jgi:predicted RNA polymerase sigma factor
VAGQCRDATRRSTGFADITFRGKQTELTHELLLNATASDEAADMMALDDDMLRLIFICCHPAFSMEVQVALTLRTVCGLSTLQVARAFRQARTRWRSASSAPSRKSALPNSLRVPDATRASRGCAGCLR